MARAQNPNEWIEQNLASLIKTYVQLHSHPELSFQEEKTSEFVAGELEAVGFEVTRHVGGFGVVAIMANGSGPTVMVRCDLDGLPITEKTDLPYASTRVVTDADGNQVGTMHACGHDVHMTCLIGVARYLATHRDQWQGRLMLIGQPAEERGSGAVAMLKDNLFERFGKPDCALALHVSSTHASGTVAVCAGYAMANVDSVDIEIIGRGGHGAYPHTTIDPIVIAAKLILDLQTIVSREVKPIEPAVVTVGSIHAGTKHNIIPDRCHLQLTVRTYRDDVRRDVLAAIERKATAAAASAGAEKPEVKVSEGTPALENNAEMTGLVRELLVQALTADRVVDTEPVMGGEDFGQFGRAGVPIVMFQLGAVDRRKLEYFQQQGITPPSLHTATFAPDLEPTLQTGVVAMTHCVLGMLRESPKANNR